MPSYNFGDSYLRWCIPRKRPYSPNLLLSVTVEIGVASSNQMWRSDAQNTDVTNFTLHKFLDSPTEVRATQIFIPKSSENGILIGRKGVKWGNTPWMDQSDASYQCLAVSRIFLFFFLQNYLDKGSKSTNDNIWINWCDYTYIGNGSFQSIDASPDSWVLIKVNLLHAH